MHRRTPTPLDQQAVVRPNRDTLYSAAVFDLDAGRVTVTLPDASKRFMSMQIINEDQYTPMVVYGKGAHTLSRERIGTCYVMVGVRTLVDPSDPKNVRGDGTEMEKQSRQFFTVLVIAGGRSRSLRFLAQDVLPI
jgi:hypothetical protein